MLYLHMKIDKYVCLMNMHVAFSLVVFVVAAEEASNFLANTVVLAL